MSEDKGRFGAPGKVPQVQAGPDSVLDVRPLMRGWLHVGALLAALVAGPLLASRAPTPWTAAALSIYAASLVALFGVSAAFHRVRWSPPARRLMRRADHSTIFVAIAGTYTAVAALALRGWAQILVLTLVWVGTAVGITLRQVWLDAPKWAVALPYVVVGWVALAVVPQLVRGLRSGGFALVLAGARSTAWARSSIRCVVPIRSPGSSVTTSSSTCAPWRERLCTSLPSVSTLSREAEAHRRVRRLRRGRLLLP